MIKEAIKKVVGKEDLTYDEAYAVMNEIMSGETSAVENAAYLAALSTKSSGMETIDEISGSAAAMREHAERVEHDMEVVDIVGTGGDHSVPRCCGRTQGLQARQPRGLLVERHSGLP